MLRLDARDTLGVLLAVEDTGVVEDLQALETALAAVDAGSVDAQGVRLLAAGLRPALLAVMAFGGVAARLSAPCVEAAILTLSVHCGTICSRK